MRHILPSPLFSETDLANIISSPFFLPLSPFRIPRRFFDTALAAKQTFELEPKEILNRPRGLGSSSLSPTKPEESAYIRLLRFLPFSIVVLMTIFFLGRRRMLLLFSA